MKKNNIRTLKSDLEKLINKAWEVRQRNFPSSIHFSIPTETSAISLTGDKCQLNCAHCGGHYLKGMKTPEDILCPQDNASKSYLISGGCNEKGSINFGSNFSFLKSLKKDNKKLNMHLGLIEKDKIDEMTSLADCVSFDFLVDEETIREVYGLDKSANDYIETYQALRKKVKVLPHLCIGLKGGEIKGELDSLRVLKELGADGLVFIVFIPTPGTAYANKKPPELEQVLEILSKARIAFPDIPIHLGCMRPKGLLRAELDYFAIQCGVNKLVNPTRMGIDRASQLGLEIIFEKECCVL